MENVPCNLEGRCFGITSVNRGHNVGTTLNGIQQNEKKKRKMKHVTPTMVVTKNDNSVTMKTVNTPKYNTHECPLEGRVANISQYMANISNISKNMQNKETEKEKRVPKTQTGPTPTKSTSLQKLNFSEVANIKLIDTETFEKEGEEPEKRRKEVEIPSVATLNTKSDSSASKVLEMKRNRKLVKHKLMYAQFLKSLGRMSKFQPGKAPYDNIELLIASLLEMETECYTVYKIDKRQLLIFSLPK